MNSAMRLLPLVLLIALSGCATRSSQTNVAASPDSLAEGTVARLLSVWQDRLCRYVDREGDGNPAVLVALKGLRSADVLRPARITFGALDVDADEIGRDGWDVRGVLVGTQKSGADTRYVFLVGIVGHNGYLPSKIGDIRLVGLVAQAGKLSWETGAADPAAVQRYRDTFRGPGASRFPGDDDSFSINIAGDRVSVRERRSGADWSLTVRTSTPERGSSLATSVESGASRRNCILPDERG